MSETILWVKILTTYLVFLVCIVFGYFYIFSRTFINDKDKATRICRIIFTIIYWGVIILLAIKFFSKENIMAILLELKY